MTTSPPDAGTAWARHCPTAYPYAWFNELKLGACPPGFTRFATDDEADLITGTITEEEYKRRSRRPVITPSRSSEGPSRAGRGVPRDKPKRRSQRATVARRFKELSDFMRITHATLTPAQRTVWLAVYTFAERGTATVTQATMARIGGVTERSIKRAVAALVRRGLLEILEQGRPGRCSSYRYRAQAE
jgi:DNA-binding MarR family transcriptional regulator